MGIARRHPRRGDLLRKVMLFMLMYVWFRATFPRFRFDQLMDLGWKWMIPLALANIFVTGVFILAGQERLMYWIGRRHRSRAAAFYPVPRRNEAAPRRAVQRWPMQVEYPKPRWSDKFLLLDMLEGLKTTLRELFKPKVTIRYPEERMEPADRFRGMFKFSYDRCIACKLCAVACPIDIIYIDVHDEQHRRGRQEEEGQGPRPLRHRRQALHVLRALRRGLPDEAEVDLADHEDLRAGQLRPQRSLLQHAAARVLGRPSAVHRACPRKKPSKQVGDGTKQIAAGVQ